EPPDLGPNAKQRKERLGDRNASQPLRLSAARQVDVSRCVELIEAGHTVKRPVLVSKVDEVSHLNGLRGEILRRAVGDPYEAIRLLERQRAQKECLADAEPRRAGPDPEPGDRDAEHRRALVEAQGSNGETDVATDVRHARLMGLSRDWTDSTH